MEQLILPLIAVLLCLAISVNIIALTIVAPALTNYGQYSSRQHTEYAVISTLLASLLTTVIVSRIRQLWISHVDLQLAESTRTLKQLEDLNTRWCTALSLAGPLEMLRYGWVFSSYIIAGLITTAIVASVTPKSRHQNSSLLTPNSKRRA